MICDILHTIEKYDMIKKGETVAVGVSGGADSVCLLHFLSRIMEKYGIVVKAVHVNHNIRGQEALRDESFVKDFCKSLGVELVSFSVDVPLLSKELSLSEEECGRKVRYECFEKVVADKIATAHTLSDSAETVVFNLARGTGIKGVTGISPVRGNIIRPLIEMTRSDVEKYCNENGLDYVTDSTNLCDDYTRNKIRHKVVPVLKEVNPGFEKSICRFTEIAASENDFLEQCAKELIKTSAFGNGYKRQVLLSSHEAVLKRAIALMLFEKMQKDLQHCHVELCLDIIKQGSGAVEVSKGLYLTADDDIINLCEMNRDVLADVHWSVDALPGKTKTPFGTFEIEICDSSKIPSSNFCGIVAADGIDASRLIFRSRESGDEFTSLRRKNTKTLKKLFIENKIPKEDRHKKAVLCFENNILWVETLGTNAKYVVSSKTQNVIIIKKIS